MIESVSRKMLKEERIAICSQFGCGTIKKVKPLKFGSLGFRKYPKCSKHKLSLVFVDEFIEQFISSVNSCLFDISSLPPKDLINCITKDDPEELKLFLNVWMYCSPIGRGAQVVSRYLDGLSKAYIKLLSRKQRKVIQGGKKSKNTYNMLRKGLKKIAEEYTLFLQELRIRSHDYCDPSNVQPLSKKTSNIIIHWRNEQLTNYRKLVAKMNDQNDILILKKKYDDILNLRTASLILGKHPTEKISAFELFSAYFEFSKEGMCGKLRKENIQNMLNVQETDTENSSLTPREALGRYQIKIENNEIKAFPIKVRNVICKRIYRLIKQNPSIDLISIPEEIISDLRKGNSKWLNDLHQGAINNIQVWLIKEHNLKMFKDYLVNLMMIIKKLKDLNDSKEAAVVDIRQIASTLFIKGCNLNQTKESFEITLRKLFDYIQKEIPNFKIERIKQKKLYFNEKEKLKQCSHCDEILPFKEFSYITQGRKKRLRHICNKCKNLSSKKQVAIKKMKTKLFLLENLGNTCICRKDMIEILPAISFHHTTDKKTYTWSEGIKESENRETILNKLKSDHASPLCENCHRLETATIFRKYKKLILLDDLFNKSAEDILILIEDQIKNEHTINKPHIRKYLKRWIRKRYIIEKFFDVKCKCCGETVINNLPAFAMHHLEKIEDPSRWGDISDNNCEEIIDVIVNERIIFLCSNCHRIVHSVFHQHVEEILENYSDEYIRKIKSKATERYNKIISILEDIEFKFKKSDIKSPLKVYTFSSQDTWKLYLLQFYYVKKKLGISSFRRQDFTQFFHINLRNVSNWIPKLLEKDYFKIETPTLSQYQYYSFSSKGLKMIQKIENEHKKEAQREYEKIFSSDTVSIIRPLRYRVFMKVHKYPNVSIGDLIRKFFVRETEKSVRNYYYEARNYFSKRKPNQI